MSVSQQLDLTQRIKMWYIFTNEGTIVAILEEGDLSFYQEMNTT